MEDAARETENRKKIVLIGPVYPYKGGIAHYTALLYRALAGRHDVALISYKMQYPKFLFRKPQKDYSNDLFKVDEARFLINTANPFNILAIGRTIKKTRPDAVIFQWWHPYFAPCYWLLCCTLGQRTRKLFLCHNVFPHERFPMDRLLTRLALRKGDSFIVHSKSDGEDLLKVKRDAAFRRTPHPTYNAFRAKDLTKEQAREMLGKGAEEKLLLFFGFVREYKGLKHLIQAMPAIREGLGRVTLMVVGSFDGDKDEYLGLIQECGVEDCVEIVDDYIPDGEVEKYFAACDLVACPYESATQSGIIQIAFGFEKPVVCTNVGGLPDVVEDGVTGYVVEPRNPAALAGAVTKCYVGNLLRVFEGNVREKAWQFSWERMVENIEGLVEGNFTKSGKLRQNIQEITYTTR